LKPGNNYKSDENESQIKQLMLVNPYKISAGAVENGASIAAVRTAARATARAVKKIDDNRYLNAVWTER